MFDILIYTDCAENESLSGRSGFQFTAKSPDASATDEDFVRQRMQHSVPIGMPPADWEQHPPTCAYAVNGGRMYLSRGRSTGATLSGRPGNQLTETIVTGDEFSILPLYPAQLFSAPDWSLTPPGRREVPAWASPLEIAPEFDIPALHALVSADPWASSTLPAFLTMVEQTQGESRVRLVIRHHDQSVVMQWVALASRFLEPEAALRLEFRVFAEDPISTSAHILGAHPDLTPGFDVRRGSAAGVNVVDLEAHESTAVEPSVTATRHAAWFLAGDPFEALEAIEVSTRWAAAMDAGLAVRAAEIACLTPARAVLAPAALRTVLDAIGALADAGQGDELEAYGDQLVDAVAGVAPTGAPDLLAMVGTVWSLQAIGQTQLAGSLALVALEWAAAQPSSAAAWAAAPGPAGRILTWADEESGSHAAGLVGTVLNSAETTDLDRLFTLAATLGVDVDPVALADPVGRLAGRWRHDPGLTPQAGTWLHSGVVYAELRRGLAAALDLGEADAVASLRAGQWDWMLSTPGALDATEPMAPWLAARAARSASAAERADILRSVAPLAPDWAWSLFLETGTSLDPEETAAWIQVHGSLAPDLAERIERLLAATASDGPWQRRGGVFLEELSRRPPSGMTSGLAQAVTDHRRIGALFAAALADRTKVPNAALTQLGRDYPGSLTALYAEPIVDCLIECSDVAGAFALTKGGDQLVAAALDARLESGLRAGDQHFLVAALALFSEAPDDWSALVKKTLDAVWDDSATEPVRARMIATLPAAWDPILDAYVKGQGRGRIARGVLRAARSVFRDKER